VICSSRRPIPSACSAALLLLLVVCPAGAQQPTPSTDETLVGQLAALLAAADARRLDASAIRDALANPNPAVRRQAALAAGRIGDAAAVDLLVPVLGDTNPAVQAAAAFALGLLKDPRALPPLLQLVRVTPAAEQGPPQVEAVTAIAKTGGDEGARALLEIIATGSPGAPPPTPPAVAAALLEAWRLGSRAPVTELVAFAESPDLNARWRALYALGRLRTPRGAARLIAALADREPAIRAVAARGVTKALLDSARVDARGAVDRLRPLLDDQNPQVRINALRAVASFRDSGLAAAVAPLVADQNIGVAVQAETTLGALRGAATVQALRPRLASSVFALRRQALIALAQVDSAGGVAAAAQVMGDADWRWRSVAAEAFGAARARDRLEGQLADPDGRVVAQALQALQRIVAAPPADTTLLPRARVLLAHADPAVRSLAADLLGAHPNPEDVDLLVQAYRRAESDPFNDARLSAVAALGAIAGASPTGRLRVATRFVGVVARPDDYLVRRLAGDTLPDAREAWGPAVPVATGRTAAEYRDVARRWLAPALTGEPNPRVTLETDRGTLEIELLPAEAPLTVAAFLGLVERRFFDGTRWHRVVPNFVVQDGDPRGDGWGGPGFVLRDEVNPVRYDVGTVGMALSGPDTGGSQYFITHSAQPHLDGIYTVFGRVAAGGAVLDAIAQGDRIRSIHR
jgi:cyclophilin family peptidyl-prolyl cis-trans isomerase/HEAT repeat protein